MAKLAYVYRFGMWHGKARCDLALPLFNLCQAKKIEQATLRIFEANRVVYSPKMESSFSSQVVKVGITKHLAKRLKSVNRRPESGKTEYLRISPMQSFFVSLFMVSYWFWFVTLRPTLFLYLFFEALLSILYY